jgi:cell wall-associated NlpC family hydrolase
MNAIFSLVSSLQPPILRFVKQISLTILALIALFSSALAKTYVVQPGDTLYSLAKTSGISLAQLMVLNKGIASNLKPGQRLNLPESARIAKTSKTPSAQPKASSSTNFSASLRSSSTNFSASLRSSSTNFSASLRSSSTNFSASLRSSRTGNSSVIQAAYRNLGARYVWGASRPGAFDCSGFTMYVMRQSGINLPHSSSAQFRMGRSVSRGNLQAGDLVFFSLGTRGIVGHVGLYIGNGRMIHASTPSTGVIVSSLSESYYASRYLGARRVM